MSPEARSANLDYHRAASPLGGSYAENKWHRLRLPELKGARVLDLGCNSGFFCAQALASGAARVVGVDLDKQVIAEARRQHPAVEFYDEGWNRLPEGEFDIVLLLSAIHYAPDPVALVDSILRQLSPTGLLVIEGGLIDRQLAWRSDCPMPGWRQVGDQCRHLSGGYVRRHLLTAFDWEVRGASEPRGGDDVARYVLHARPAVVARPRAREHVIDMLEFVQALAQSARTIVPARRSHAYVSRLDPAVVPTAATVEALLSDPQVFDLIMDDLTFALQPSSGLPVVLWPNLSSGLVAALRSALGARGVLVVAPRHAP